MMSAKLLKAVVVLGVLAIPGAALGKDDDKIQIAGVTSATFNGAQVGGVWGGALKCDTEFEETRMCTGEEFQRSFPPFPSFPNFAWIETANSEQQVIPSPNCNDWSASSSGVTGRAVRADGARSTASCSASLAIACCGPVAKPKHGDYDNDGDVDAMDFSNPTPECDSFIEEFGLGAPCLP